MNSGVGSFTHNLEGELCVRLFWGLRELALHLAGRWQGGLRGRLRLAASDPAPVPFSQRLLQHVAYVLDPVSLQPRRGLLPALPRLALANSFSPPPSRLSLSGRAWPVGRWLCGSSPGPARTGGCTSTSGRGGRCARLLSRRAAGGDGCACACAWRGRPGPPESQPFWGRWATSGSRWGGNA